MRDIPMFTTDNGIGSLIVKNIPYNKCGYIRLHDASNPQNFLKECYDFLKIAGADKVIATGNFPADDYVLHTQVIEMTAKRTNISSTDVEIKPIGVDCVEEWRQLYNKKMMHVPIASFLSSTEANEIASAGRGYYIYRDQVPIGLAIGAAERIEAIASFVAGAGKDVVCALCSVLTEDEVALEVASTNTKAIRLYESLGFQRNSILAQWYEIDV